ncbi:hypothetical protein SS50377_23522 [Spironucleus salmonicida]|uniref:Uncharacterized protein n=1 Tax=Spironucleus salmonicida TaxID=348837 RepID=V6LRD8_9EUKA|nr:hypothetical protein SS50377_23518 [Spironucleus salmonicida]KAH0573587.1 hypothetical protein SS50377_23522 [Spironucleus salmonicida]|eukprot:EST46256.1 Hypothetical protein SS50377_13852 [Spironucleus salmonicida]
MKVITNNQKVLQMKLSPISLKIQHVMSPHSRTIQRSLSKAMPTQYDYNYQLNTGKFGQKYIQSTQSNSLESFMLQPNVVEQKFIDQQRSESLLKIENFKLKVKGEQQKRRIEAVNAINKMKYDAHIENRRCIIQLLTQKAELEVPISEILSSKKKVYKQ